MGRKKRRGLHSNIECQPRLLPTYCNSDLAAITISSIDKKSFCWSISMICHSSYVDLAFDCDFFCCWERSLTYISYGKQFIIHIFLFLFLFFQILSYGSQPMYIRLSFDCGQLLCFPWSILCNKTCVYVLGKSMLDGFRVMGC